MQPTDMSTLDQQLACTENENNGENTSAADMGINQLTLRFESSAITSSCTSKSVTNISNGEPSNRYAHRQPLLRSFQSPIQGRSTNDAQSLRIQEALAWQRQHRNKQTAKARQIALGELSLASDEEEVEEERSTQLHRGCKRKGFDNDSADDDDVIMEDRKVRCLEPVRHNGSSKRKDYSQFANQVMYAETMESIPSDFLTEWVMIICPTGKRCLVTSGNGQTVARARSGRVISRFQSNLPNGSINRGHGSSSNYCILDCVYDAANWTFYVLDLMCWNGYAIYDCDTDFRHFWLSTKLCDANLHLYTHQNNKSKKDLYQFKPLIPVSTTEAKQAASDPRAYLLEHQSPLSYDIDGFLFYHRKTQYVTGSTPLVCWLPLDQVNMLLE